MEANVTKAKPKAEREREAEKRMRKRVGWTRTEWINHAEHGMGVGLITYLEWCLAHRNGKRRLAQRWWFAFDRELARTIVELSCHPLRRRFDIRAAFEQAIAEERGVAASFVDYVTEGFAEVHGKIRRRVRDDDIERFFERVRFHGQLLDDRITAAD
jgi:hypothetical protein